VIATERERLGSFRCLIFLLIDVGKIVLFTKFNPRSVTGPSMPANPFIELDIFAVLIVHHKSRVPVKIGKFHEFSRNIHAPIVRNAPRADVVINLVKSNNFHAQYNRCFKRRF
jgi:hypothetical protein